MANTISPPNYPSSNRTPGTFFSLDNSNANTSVANLQTLLIGQMLSTGTATPNVPFLASSQTLVNTSCGVSSMLANMMNVYTGDDGFAEIWILPVLDAAGGTAAVNTITYTGPATASGSLSLYICGVLVSVAITSGDTATIVATNTVAAIALNPQLPVTAVAAAGVVTLTAVHKGIAAGDVDLRLNYLGPINGQNTPAGLTVVFANTTPGATDPTLTTALANLTGQYAFICNPYSGATQVGQVQAIQSDVNGSWSWLSNTGGGQFSAYKNTYATVQTYGVTNNLQHLSVFGISSSPTPVSSIAASYCAVCANSLRADPALPLTAIIMNGVMAPAVSQQYTRLMRNVLLYDGIATWTANAAGQVILERAVTSYQTNTVGQPDNSYLDVNTLYTLQAWIATAKTQVSSKYARVKLVNNATPIRPGTNTVNPNAIQSEVVAVYQATTDAGLTQDVPTFIKNVAVQQVSPNQCNVYAPIQIATGLYQLAFDVAFTL
jgi:phage tail sheath gpL-like